MSFKEFINRLRLLYTVMTALRKPLHYVYLEVSLWIRNLMSFEVILMSCCLETLVLERVSSWNMFSMFPNDVSIQQDKVPQLLVWQPLWKKTLCHKSGVLKEEPWYLLTQEFVSLMSLTRWMTLIEPQYMRPWSSKVSQFPRQELLLLWKHDAVLLQLQILSKEPMMTSLVSKRMSSCQIQFSQDLIFS